MHTAKDLGWLVGCGGRDGSGIALDAHLLAWRMSVSAGIYLSVDSQGAVRLIRWGGFYPRRRWHWVCQGKISCLRGRCLSQCFLSGVPKQFISSYDFPPLFCFAQFQMLWVEKNMDRVIFSLAKQLRLELCVAFHFIAWRSLFWGKKGRKAVFFIINFSFFWRMEVWFVKAKKCLYVLSWWLKFGFLWKEAFIHQSWLSL